MLHAVISELFRNPVLSSLPKQSGGGVPTPSAVAVTPIIAARTGRRKKGLRLSEPQGRFGGEFRSRPETGSNHKAMERSFFWFVFFGRKENEHYRITIPVNG